MTRDLIPGTMRYVIFTQVLGGEPYVYAMLSNSRSAIELCDIMKRENPGCRIWKRQIKGGMIPPGYCVDYGVEEVNEEGCIPGEEGNIS